MKPSLLMEGIEIASVEGVKLAASAAMADLAKNVLPGSVGRKLAIEVRDDFWPVLRVSLHFQVEHLQNAA